MKRFKGISLIIMIISVFTALFVLSPLTVSAEDELGDYEGIYDVTVKDEYYHTANVHSDGVTVSTEDEANAGTVYSFDVATTGAAYSSFKLTISMPSFVDVSEVTQSYELLNVSENGVFKSNVSGSTVSVSFSSPTNFSDIPLFSISFTVNDYSERSSAVECYDYQLVNEDVEIVGAAFELGYISIAKSVMMGDVNADLTVNLADLLIIQRSLVNDLFPLSYAQYLAADIDKNGEVDMLDCQYIQNYLVGKIGSLEDIGVATPPEECKHESVYTDAKDATCTDYGYYIVRCESCKEIISERYIEAYGHSFGEDGYCVNCGERESAGDEKELVYYYNSKELTLNLYSDNTSYFTKLSYTADGRVEKYEGEGEWYILAETGLIYAYVNGDEYVFTANDWGELIPYEGGGDVVEPDVCYHESRWTDGIGATCTDSGHIREICNDCGEIVSESYFDALGHDFADGTCTRCGEIEEIVPDEKDIRYTYASEELMLYLFSDYTSEYAELVYTEDGSITNMRGENKWYEADGKIYAFTDTARYVFTATASGELVLC